jgi:hypothetical protein
LARLARTRRCSETVSRSEMVIARVFRTVTASYSPEYLLLLTALDASDPSLPKGPPALCLCTYPLLEQGDTTFHSLIVTHRDLAFVP